MEYRRGAGGWVVDLSPAEVREMSEECIAPHIPQPASSQLGFTTFVFDAETLRYVDGETASSGRLKQWAIADGSWAALAEIARLVLASKVERAARPRSPLSKLLRKVGIR